MEKRAYWTLKEIDFELNLRKGSSFRSFRQIEKTLSEGRDYLLLDHERDREKIESLRRQGRIYPSSIQVVILFASGYGSVLKHLKDGIKCASG